MDLENVVRIGELLDCYGNLLADRPRQCMARYYLEDWSLAEIAADLSISRQAVHDHLHRAVEQLERYEAELKVIGQRENRKRQALALLAQMSAEERARYGQAIKALSE